MNRVSRRRRGPSPVRGILLPRGPPGSSCAMRRRAAGHAGRWRRRCPCRSPGLRVTLVLPDAHLQGMSREDPWARGRGRVATGTTVQAGVGIGVQAAQADIHRLAVGLIVTIRHGGESEGDSGSGAARTGADENDSGCRRCSGSYRSPRWAEEWGRPWCSRCCGRAVPPKARSTANTSRSPTHSPGS